MAVINRPVIVMALFDIGRDNWDNFTLSYNTYLWWMKNTLSLDADFVVYTEDKFYEEIRSMRKEFDPNLERTKIINCPLQWLPCYVQYNERLENLMFSEEFRRKVHHDVPEMTKPLYNIIMFNKLDFLRHAKDEKFFDGDMYIWADAGGLREDINNYKGNVWPDLDKLRGLDTDKVTFFSHSHDFNIDDKEFHSMSQIRHIQGTAFFCPSHLIEPLHKDFNDTIVESINDGYMGSDEKVFDITYLKNKSMYNLIKCTWREYYDIFK